MNNFSKIYERYTIHHSPIPYINKCLSEFVAACRKSYYSSHVLIRLVENCKTELDNKKYVEAILMDLLLQNFDENTNTELSNTENDSRKLWLNRLKE